MSDKKLSDLFKYYFPLSLSGIYKSRIEKVNFFIQYSTVLSAERSAENLQVSYQVNMSAS